MSKLRTELIRLAHDQPELRADLLPLLGKQAAKGTFGQETLEFQADWLNQILKEMGRYFDDWEIQRMGDQDALFRFKRDLGSNRSEGDTVRVLLTFQDGEKILVRVETDDQRDKWEMSLWAKTLDKAAREITMDVLGFLR